MNKQLALKRHAQLSQSIRPLLIPLQFQDALTDLNSQETF
jgi:hypothetical protein